MILFFLHFSALAAVAENCELVPQIFTWNAFQALRSPKKAIFVLLFVERKPPSLTEFGKCRMSVSGAHGDTIGFYSFRLYRNAMKCIGIGTLYRTSVEVEKIWTFLVCNGEREHHTLKQKWNLLVSTWPQEFVVVFVVCTFSNVTKATAAGSDEILSSDMRNEQESESVKEPNRTNGGKRQERDGQKLLSTLFKNRNYVIWNLVTKLWNSVINADEREKWTQTLPIYFCLIYLDFIFRKGPHPTFPHFSISFLWFVCFLYHAPCGLERNKERERYPQFLSAQFGRSVFFWFVGSLSHIYRFAKKEAKDVRGSFHIFFFYFRCYGLLISQLAYHHVPFFLLPTKDKCSFNYTFFTSKAFLFRFVSLICIEHIFNGLDKP